MKGNQSRGTPWAQAASVISKISRWLHPPKITAGSNAAFATSLPPFRKRIYSSGKRKLSLLSASAISASVGIRKGLSVIRSSPSVDQYRAVDDSLFNQRV